MTEKNNVRVTNDTIDFYRYFDATPHAEFLFECIRRTLDEELPDELLFLENRDAFHRAVNDIVDMPERLLDRLIHFLRQNHGHLSKRAREKEFAALTENEAQAVENAYARIFTR